MAVDSKERQDQSDNKKHSKSNKNKRMVNNAYSDEKTWIRGVNVGGWLLAERFITPYLFAVNSCHLQGSLCWYPGQVGAPPNLKYANETNIASPTTTASTGSEDKEKKSKHHTEDESYYTLCNPDVCQPILPVVAKEPTDYHPRISYAGTMDYPIDEWTLGQTLQTSVGGLPMAQKYMERHWDTFVSEEDFKDLAIAGVTHLRIPMSYWIRRGYGYDGMELQEDEPYIPGAWPYFVRACHWARKYNLTVWADLHGAPGSENGFDNSGHFLGRSSCDGWDKNPLNVERTVDVLTDLAHAIKEDGLDDVVTGFGVLNEPFADCDEGGVTGRRDRTQTGLRMAG